MRGNFRTKVFILMLALGIATPILSQEVAIGRTVDSLLDYARSTNPDYASMRYEADAAIERVVPAGALPDPRFRMELQDITKFGEQNATLNPSRVGSTKYTVLQEIPWYGKRDLKREIAELEAEGAQGRVRGTWTEITAKLKIAHAQLYILHRNEQLTREILDLMVRLEKIAQIRYAGGLAMQQDAIRAQVEQTGMRNDLIMLENEGNMLRARINALLARPSSARLANPEVLRPIPAPAKLDYATLEDRVRGRNPQLFTEEARIKAAEKSRELTYKNRYPDFALAISPIQYQNAVKEWEVMVEFNIPLQQTSRRAMERESESMLSAARSRKEATSNQILGELAENLSGIEAARRTESLTTNSLLPQAELTFNSALASYENGKVDFATLLEAQQQIRKARQIQIKAQAEAQIRLAEIEKLLGEDL
ncbi:Outer membrane protein [Candidatus Propionivibrio aalborgensis]|uniref:Outer membrane protein n=1 Tax=Candidatus Propionivibrio aalborgensis TaxID=1860101 RepID=A0A1A8Y0B3_9RHOO|nr:TolC family protein [Candidatus Propionivibrio aalborgensis]SBT10406.1 Outer membrane protein [Candidatus Propionivibrio aalborgensis]